VNHRADVRAQYNKCCADNYAHQRNAAGVTS
jgi:hypothetical protein